MSFQLLTQIPVALPSPVHKNRNLRAALNGRRQALGGGQRFDEAGSAERLRSKLSYRSEFAHLRRRHSIHYPERHDEARATVLVFGNHLSRARPVLLRREDSFPKSGMLFLVEVSSSRQSAGKAIHHHWSSEVHRRSPIVAN